MNDLIARMARLAARGWRQEQLVTELLTGPVPVRYKSMGARRFVVFGVTEVSSSSYYSLRNRLVRVGFVFERKGDRKGDIVTMSFPEKKGFVK